MKQNDARRLAVGGVIAALYVALTYISAAFGLASGAIQVRLSEALTILRRCMVWKMPGGIWH